MKITEKVSYIKGLAEGLSLDETSAQGKVISAIIDALEEMAKELSDLKEDTEYLDAYIEEIDEDLGMLEEDYYEDGGCDCDDEDCGCDDDFVEVECPECGETVCLDDSIDFDHVICPACGAELVACVTAATMGTTMTNASADVAASEENKRQTFLEAVAL